MLTIQTFAVVRGAIHVRAGGVTVWGFNPEEEIEQSWVKTEWVRARRLLVAIEAPPAEPVPA